MIISAGHCDGEKLLVRLVGGSKSTPALLVYEDQLARDPPPPVPGGFIIDQKVYYTGANCKLPNGKTTLTYGQEFIVMGKVPGKARIQIGQDREIGSVSNVTASQISPSAPPPLLGGFEVSETVYYLGPVRHNTPPPFPIEWPSPYPKLTVPCVTACIVCMHCLHALSACVPADWV